MKFMRNIFPAGTFLAGTFPAWTFSAWAMTAAILAMTGTARAAGPQGTIYQFAVPKQGSMYADAAYYCWLPTGVETLRAIIVHQHGCTREGDAQQMMTDLQWISLAKKWHAVFIAPKLITGGPGSGSTTCDNWDKIANGSGNTFLAALDTLARRAAHPEIKIVPWALWGHSGGSMWITAMAGKYPERVAVGVAEACGTEISNVPAALRVPILHHNGKADMCYNDTYFANGRSKGALWAHAVNPNPLWVNTPSNPGWSDEVFGHAPHDLRMIAIPWIEAGLAARLPQEAGSGQLKDMDTSGAWLGDKASRAIAPAAAFAGDKLAACWLPDPAFASKWAEYMEKGTLNDTSGPPAPVNLTGVYGNKQVTLKWDADADLESGIKTFIIHRNGAVYNTLKFTGATFFTMEQGFQRWQDGDQPSPAQAPAMTFTDNGLNDTATYTYQISTVNWSNVSGPKSAVLTLKRGLVTGLTGSPRPGTSSQMAGPRQSLLACGEPGSCNAKLSAGTTGIYDLQGSLLRRVVSGHEEIRDIGALLGAGAPRMVLIRTGQ